MKITKKYLQKVIKEEIALYEKNIPFSMPGATGEHILAWIKEIGALIGPGKNYPHGDDVVFKLGALKSVVEQAIAAGRRQPSE
jgi:hypothetical protein